MSATLLRRPARAPAKGKAKRAASKAAPKLAKKSWRNASALQIALFASFAVHAALLTLRFAAPAAFDRIFQESPLEVILVNTRSQEKPEKARAIAQTSLAGGGTALQGRATSPLPPALREADGDSADDMERKLEQMREQQTVLLAQIRQQVAQLPLPDPERQADTPDKIAQEEQRRRLVKQLAEIERRINEENARPKRRYVSPATREAVYAVYYDAFRRKIEEKGTLNFPVVNGKKLYGELTMIVTIDHAGQVLATQIAQSSGNAALDRRAEAIARAAAPHGNFDTEMRAKADQIVVESRFRFTRDSTLDARPMAPVGAVAPAALAQSPSQ
ncbi:MAG: TonB family protein [Burkholderiales bacterium]